MAKAIINIRVDSTIPTRAKALFPRAEAVMGKGRVTMSGLMGIALELGMPILEQRYSGVAPEVPPAPVVRATPSGGATKTAAKNAARDAQRAADRERARALGCECIGSKHRDGCVGAAALAAEQVAS